LETREQGKEAIKKWSA